MANPTSTDKPSEKPTATKPARGWRWIVNNADGVRVLILRGALSLVGKMPTPGPRIELGTGANLVDERLWAAWKDQNADQEVDGEKVPGQASLLLKGIIPEDPHKNRRQERAGKAYLVEMFAVKDQASPLADLSEPDALAVVREILEEGMLKRLLGVEKRAAVVVAIRAKLDGMAKAVQSAALGI